MRKQIARLRAWFWYRLIGFAELLFGFESGPWGLVVERCARAEIALYRGSALEYEERPDVELESFLIVATAWIWVWFFIGLFVAGWINDRRSRRA